MTVTATAVCAPSATVDLMARGIGIGIGRQNVHRCRGVTRHARDGDLRDARVGLCRVQASTSGIERRVQQRTDQRQRTSSDTDAEGPETVTSDVLQPRVRPSAVHTAAGSAHQRRASDRDE